MGGRFSTYLVSIICSVSFSVAPAFAADDNDSKFATVYDSITTTYSPAIGEVHTVKIKDIVYSEEARPVSAAFLATEDLSLSYDQGPFVLEQGTVFSSEKRYGEIIYCFSVHQYKNPNNLPTGNHCLWDENADNVPDYYRLWVWGADDYTEPVPLDAGIFDNTLQPNRSSTIKIGDHRSLSLERIEGKKIKLGFDDGGGYKNQATAAMIGISSSGNYDKRILNEMITLKYKGKEVTYVLGGMEITILGATDDTLTYRIDTPMESRTLLAHENSAFGVKWGAKLGKAKKKK